MKLYWGPHSCAIGIHILLDEIGKPYEDERIDVVGGAAQGPDFLRINPKGKVPALVRDDGSVLSEFGAIATWLARTNPEAGLIPGDPEAEARMVEILDYAVGTVHALGYGRIFRPMRFAPQEALTPAVQQQGREIIENGFALLDGQIAGKPWASGERFGIADAALSYVERWAPGVGITLPPALAAHFDRMLARPSVQRLHAIY